MVAFFSNVTMKMANRSRNKYQVIECPYCRQSSRLTPNLEHTVCYICGHDIWNVEAGYYGLLDLFSGECKWGTA